MKYSKVRTAKFVSRPNRFIAYVDIDGKTEKVHVKNTGRCRELLIPGITVIIEQSDKPERKTAYDLIAVYKAELGLVNIDSQAPNKVVGEWLLSDKAAEVFPGITFIKPEYTYGQSRLDFYLECEQGQVLMEVKGVTLEIDGQGYFPDAPTERGVKHLHELTAAVKKGYNCYLAFVIQMPGITSVLPNTTTHMAFAEALADAIDAGVKVLYLGCEMFPDELYIDRVNTIE